MDEPSNPNVVFFIDEYSSYEGEPHTAEVLEDTEEYRAYFAEEYNENIEEPITEEPITEEPITEEKGEPTEEEEENTTINENLENYSSIKLVFNEKNPEENADEKIVKGHIHIKTIPKIVFIIPYRDRETQYKFFMKHMKYIMEDEPEGSYKFYFIHQTDTRGFNRGAMKNIGFLFIKNQYPNDYKNITFVFNDVDTMPLEKGVIHTYITAPGTIKHYYGFNYALGGIISVLGEDYEKLNGFPNYWGWGYEDNYLQQKAIRMGIKIDRTNFYDIYNKNFIQLHDSTKREVNKTDFKRYVSRVNEGITSIRFLRYKENEETGFVDVVSFETDFGEDSKERTDYDLRNGATPFKDIANKFRRGSKMSMIF